MYYLHTFMFTGHGTTIDGNTARRFFKDAQKSAKITGVNFDLIQRFGVILSVLSSGYEIDVNAIEVYSLETAQRFVQLYP